MNWNKQLLNSKTEFQKTEMAGLDFEMIKKMLVGAVEKNSKQRFTVKIGEHMKVIGLTRLNVFIVRIKGPIFTPLKIEITCWTKL